LGEAFADRIRRRLAGFCRREPNSILRNLLHISVQFGDLREGSILLASVNFGRSDSVNAEIPQGCVKLVFALFENCTYFSHIQMKRTGDVLRRLSVIVGLRKYRPIKLRPSVENGKNFLE
jgi:hypothetical protein